MIGLFVSAEHLERVAHRQLPCFRATFYVLVLLLVLQLPFIGLWIVQAAAASSEATREEGVLRARRGLDADEETLRPVMRRIEQAAEWRKVLAERQRVSEVLAAVEASVPASACLSQMLIRNQTTASKGADRLDIKLVAWMKGDSKEMEERLRSRFAGYVVTAATLSSPSTEQNEGTVVEVSITPPADPPTL